MKTRSYQMFCIVMLFALAFLPVASVFAQSGGPDDEDATTQPLDFPYGPKPDATINLGDGPIKDAVAPEAFGAEELSPTAIWHTIEYETFEGIWPDAGWATWDYDGGIENSYAWNDVSTRAYASSWSAHPTAYPTLAIPYPDYAHSIMVYGPFSLAGALNARVTFKYWMVTETAYDFLMWGYSCDGGMSWTMTEKSGSTSGLWQSVTMSIKPCDGQSSVYVRFMFTSDYSVVAEGPYVDNIRIQSYY